MFGCAATPNKDVEHPHKTDNVVVADATRHLVKIDAEATDRFVKAGASSELVVRLRIGVDALPKKARSKVNLALAVDTSGSMEGDAIVHAREACMKMVDALADGDRLAIVTFDTRAEVIVPAIVLDKKSRALVRARIRAMQARGTTDMAGGLSAAVSQVTSGMLSDGINRVVLLGDGVPNDPAPLTAIAQQARQNGIAITSLGLGLDYDETLMGQVAQLSGGKFHYVRSSEQVASVLEEEVLKIERVAGRNASLQLVAGPGVTIVEVVGHQLPMGQRVGVPVGDLVAGEQRDVVVRLSAPARAAGAVVELVDAELTYQDALGSGASVQERGFVSVRATEDLAEIKGGHNDEIDLATARASVAALVIQAIATARAGNLPEAQRLVDRAEKIAREEGRDDAELKAKALEMPKLRKSLSAIVPAPQAIAPPNGSPPVAAPRPADAAAVREAHGAAVGTIQGG
jgi:Ca-activated chloride channel family protein